MVVRAFRRRSRQPVTASITRAGIWREVLEFVRLPLPLLRVRRGRFFDRNIWPDPCVFRIQRQPFLKPGFAISLYGCKTMDCVEVCPVDCFYEGENMLVMHILVPTRLPAHIFQKPAHSVELRAETRPVSGLSLIHI